MAVPPAGNSPVAGIYMNGQQSDEADYVDVAEEVHVYTELDLRKPGTSASRVTSSGLLQGRRLAALISVAILVTLGLGATGFFAYYFTVGGGAQSTVEDVDECAHDKAGCEDNCTNTHGSYFCGCSQPGMALSDDQHSCTDINECADNNGGCEDRCINTLGSYICECTQPGQTLSEDGHNCHGCIRMADLTFVIDASGSINELDVGNWDRELNFVASVMQDPQLVISLSNVRVGAVVYNNFARVEFYLSETTNADDMAGRVRNFSYDGGNTNIADALRKARREVFNEQSGDRPDAPNILVLLTDGKPNEEEGNTRPEAEMARQAGINIIGIGVTSEIDLTLLSDIATRPVLIVESFSELTSFLAQTVALICDTTPTN